jgi:hypothetical protein
MEITVIIFNKGGLKQTVGYTASREEALKLFHKEYGYPKILFIHTR